jgi:hypothetical protein
LEAGLRLRPLRQIHAGKCDEQGADLVRNMTPPAQ